MTNLLEEKILKFYKLSQNNINTHVILLQIVVITKNEPKKKSVCITEVGDILMPLI